MNLKLILAIAFILANATIAFSQSNPDAFNLGSDSYDFVEWDSTSLPGTYPPNMIFHVFENSDPNLETEPTGDWVCAYDIDSRSRINGLGTAGLAFANTGNIQDTQERCGNGPDDVGGFVGTAVVSLNTLNRQEITINFTAGLITQGLGVPVPREYGLRLQYRVGAGGAWISAPGNVLFSSAGKQAGDLEQFTNVVLPATCNNQNLVQIRWKYYQIASNDGASRPAIQLDDIYISSSVFTGGVELPILYINEIMASNTSAIADGTGAFEDWFEIYNPNDTDINISGFYVTDDLNNPTKHLISSEDGPLIVPANGFLIMWASDAVERGDNHTNFKLSTSGESVGLFYSDGISAIDAYTFGPQTENVSEGRVTDGNSNWTFFEASTPGASNSTISSIQDTQAFDFKLFPNPASEFINVQSNSSTIYSIEIYNMNGVIVQKSNFNMQERINLSISELNSGIYLVKIITKAGVGQLKFIKQ